MSMFPEAENPRDDDPDFGTAVWVLIMVGIAVLMALFLGGDL
jgi:hypothetical protein